MIDISKLGVPKRLFEILVTRRDFNPCRFGDTICFCSYKEWGYQSMLNLNKVKVFNRPSLKTKS